MSTDPIELNCSRPLGLNPYQEFLPEQKPEPFRLYDTIESLACSEAQTAKKTFPQAPTLPAAKPASEAAIEQLHSEVVFLYFLFQASQQQKAQNEDDRNQRLQEVRTEKNLEKAFHKKWWDAHKESAELSSRMKTVDTVSTVLSIGSIVTLVGSLLATVLTKGAAFPLVMYSLQGLVSLSQGGTEIAKTRFKAEFAELQSKMFLLKDQSKESADKSKVELQACKDLSAQLPQYDKYQRELVDAARKTIQAIYN